jgi:hypothetical protein
MIDEKKAEIKPICFFDDLEKVIKAVTPAKAGVQNYLFFLDSGFRRNDRRSHFVNFYDRNFFDLQKRCFLLGSYWDFLIIDQARPYFSRKEEDHGS